METGNADKPAFPAGLYAPSPGKKLAPNGRNTLDKQNLKTIDSVCNFHRCSSYPPMFAKHPADSDG